MGEAGVAWSPLTTPSILFIDAFDSYSNNIISLLITTLNCSVKVVTIDYCPSDEDLYKELKKYDAVVCGPGPGSPTVIEDVGLMARIWNLPENSMLPVLGVCLGFQSLGFAFGAEIKELPTGVHGIIHEIEPTRESIHFHNSAGDLNLLSSTGKVMATLYHSLYVNLGQEDQVNQAIQSKQNGESEILKGSFQRTPALECLAWARLGRETDISGKITSTRSIPMIIKHKEKPFYALQFHPESICSNEECVQIVRNWFNIGQAWIQMQPVSYRRKRYKARRTLSNFPSDPTIFGKSSLLSQSRICHSPESQWHSWMRPDLDSYQSITKDVPPGISVADIISIARGSGPDQIILDSSNANIRKTGSESTRGRYSVVGLDVSNALQIHYSTGTDWVHLQPRRVTGLDPKETSQISLLPWSGIWPFLASFMDQYKLTLKGDLPFHAGFMGYMTYELGLERIGLETKNNIPKKDGYLRPDLCFAFVTRSIVIDHMANQLHMQELTDAAGMEKNGNWLNRMSQLVDDQLAELSPTHELAPFILQKSPKNLDRAKAFQPLSREYESKVKKCQQYIARGQSYELCLTDQTQVTNCRQPGNTGRIFNDWSLYCRLRARQPAPFASFISLGGATFISASPERFLTWNKNNKCTLFPMKGTVKKSSTISTLAQAERLLSVPKEIAENLMIVDLVRHDLHGVCGAGNVSVPRLMVVEEHASVFQMVSVIEGQLPQPKAPSSTTEEGLRNADRYTGLDALAASLPPGSMTGAPKMRACELLREIEKAPRSLYSGVVGYMDIGGGGDWSVNIRCMYRWEDEIGGDTFSYMDPSNDTLELWETHRELDELEELEKDLMARLAKEQIRSATDTWHIGAGGAVTALSGVKEERVEMQTKLAGTLGVFGLQPDGDEWPKAQAAEDTAPKL